MESGQADINDAPGFGVFIVVPDFIWDVIERKLDAAFVECPDAEKDRLVLRSQLIDYFDKHGVVPNFSLVSNAQS